MASISAIEVVNGFLDDGSRIVEARTNLGDTVGDTTGGLGQGVTGRV